MIDNLGIMIMVLGIAHAFSSINIIYVLSRNGYKSSIMTPLANIRKLKELSKKNKKHKGLYYIALIIGYFALVTFISFIIAIVINVGK